MEISNPGLKVERLANRLVVLIPSICQMDEFALGKQVRGLATPGKSPVLYLTVIQNYDDEMPALHRLTRLAAVTRDAWVRAEMLVVFERSWQSAIRRLHHPGDVMVCLPDHQIRSGWLGQKSMVTEVSEKLRLPVQVLKNGRSPNGAVGGKNGRENG